MAGKTSGPKEQLWGPMVTPPGNSLGAEPVNGVPKPKATPDPLGYVR